MAIGKSKKVGKGGKRGKKLVKDPFMRKEWYNVMAPAVFKQRMTGYTPVNKTTGTKLSIDSLRNRVFKVNLADLLGDEDYAHRNVSLKALDINGRELLTQFQGMSLTTDKLKSLVRKWYTTIEANMLVRTTDEYQLRVFIIGFTRRRQNSTKKTCYAQTAQVRQIRKRINEIAARELGSVSLRDAIGKLNTEVLGKAIEKECKGIYPLGNVMVRKVKVLKAPRLDMRTLLSIHQGASAPVPEATQEDKGAVVEATA